MPTARVSSRRGTAAVVAAAAAAALALAGAAWKDRGRARHPAVPLVDPSPPSQPGVELPELAGCLGSEVARVGARITALLEDGEGLLWIGTRDAGLFRAGVEELSPAGGLRGRERSVNALAEHDGLVWAATQGGLLALDGDRRVATLLGGEEVSALAVAGSLLYAGTARGVFRISIGEGAEEEVVTGPAGEPLRVTALAAGATRLWIGTASGAYSLPLATAEAPLLARTARWHSLVVGGPPAETNVVTALAPFPGGAIAGTDDGGVVRLGDDGAVSALRFTDARANEVNPGAAAARSDGAAVVGTQGGGALLVRAAGSRVGAVRLGGTGPAEVSAVHPLGERILVATAGGVVTALRCTPDASAPSRPGVAPAS